MSLSTASVVALPLMNCRFAPAAVKTRLSRSCPSSHGSTPCTSQGVPVIACDCATCRSTDPRDCRTRSSIYVQTPECAFVVDTGPDFRDQCLRENVRRIDAVVLTHAHTDHIMGFDDLRPFFWN